MGGDAGGGQAAPFSGWTDMAVSALEPQDAVGQDVRGGQRLRHAFGDGSQVLTHDQALRALALQRDLGEQVRHWVGDVGAVVAPAPSGMTNRRRRPMTWSIRNAPAWRMLATSSPLNAEKPSPRMATGSGGGSDQIWPWMEKGSGGAPTETPCISVSWPDHASAPSGAAPTARSR